MSVQRAVRQKFIRGKFWRFSGRSRRPHFWSEEQGQLGMTHSCSNQNQMVFNIANIGRLSKEEFYRPQAGVLIHLIELVVLSSTRRGVLKAQSRCSYSPNLPISPTVQCTAYTVVVILCYLAIFLGTTILRFGLPETKQKTINGILKFLWTWYLITYFSDDAYKICFFLKFKKLTKYVDLSDGYTGMINFCLHH